jgi:RNA polymerase sigma factor (TIGR02999 family)
VLTDVFAEDRFGPRIYEELRRMAGGHMGGERRNHTLQPTELLHEAWIRLSDLGRDRSLSREAFLRLASTAMRRILVDHARRRAAERRDASRNVPWTDAEAHLREKDRDLVALDAALDELAALDAELARLVELRVFARQTVDESAKALGLSPRTAKRHWKLAQGWLRRRIAELRNE